MATRTRTRVVLDHDEYEMLLRLVRRGETVETNLRARLGETASLLILAVRDLGIERQRDDLSAFTRSWLKEHRRFDSDGVPIRYGGGA